MKETRSSETASSAPQSGLRALVGSVFTGDRVLWIIIAALAVISVLVVYSSTAKMAYDAHTARSTAHFLRQQVGILILCVPIIVIVHKINCRVYNRLAQPVYVLSLLLTLAVYFIGATTNGAARWIPVAGFQFQPSEALKVATILLLARRLSSCQSKIDRIRIVPSLNPFRWGRPAQRKIWREGTRPILLPVVLSCAVIFPAHTSSAMLVFLTSLVMMLIGRVRVSELVRLVGLACAALLLAGCGASAASTAESTSEAVSTEETAPAATAAPAPAVTKAPAPAAALPDGVYTAKFNTDSSMFHANEAVDGMGTLTVENGTMTFHVSLQSQKIVNLYPGMAADAPAHESDWLQPTVDTVTYSDGTSDEVYGFDIPVAAVDADFQLAILGTKGTWYDHTVSVSDAEPAAEDAAAAAVEVPADGSYTCAVTLEGGSGRATVESPAVLTVADGIMTATIVWSSPNYDYMLVDGEKYLPVNTDGNSTFEIPVAALDTALAVTADTVAMSTPHEIDYTLTFDSATLAAAE